MLIFNSKAVVLRRGFRPKIFDEGIITVRFTYREGKVRIFGAGYWRKGRKRYEQQNNLY